MTESAGERPALNSARIVCFYSLSVAISSSSALYLLLFIIVFVVVQCALLPLSHVLPALNIRSYISAENDDDKVAIDLDGIADIMKYPSSSTSS